jgi:predicted glycosyltransferase
MTEGLRRTQDRLGQIRVLMYSHDTFGLGHLRRCRTIAHALVDAFKGVHVLIVSGSQIAGAFDFKARVDFVKIPSVIKLYNGEYTSIGRHIDIRETLAWRRAIIQSTARSFRPDLLIVDKEPLGLRGELLPTLAMLKARGCRLVVGLRDVMDDAATLRAEWAGRHVTENMARFFDDVWVYGPEGFHNPLEGLDLPPGMPAQSYTGFLRREAPANAEDDLRDLPARYILVTAGGGGDGAPMMRAVLHAHRHDPSHGHHLLVVLGPFMPAEEREEIRRLADGSSDVRVLDFHARHEVLMQHAAAVVAMAGYNTFCEILSLDRRALLLPRVAPRREQLIRAERAAALGLAEVMLPEQADDPAALAQRMRQLVERPPPMQAGAGGMMNGLERIAERVRAMFPHGSHRDVFLPPAAE